MTPRKIFTRLSFILIAAISSTVFFACKKQVVENGKLVKIHYTLKVDGAIADSSQNKPPLSYVQGRGQIIPGLEEALAGLKVGDKKQVTVSPEKGYGLIDPKAKQSVSKKLFDDTKDLKVGIVVNGQQNGRPVQAKVLAIKAKEVVLDFNHPLAGKTLDFDVEVVEITKAPEAPAAPALPIPQDNPAPTNKP